MTFSSFSRARGTLQPRDGPKQLRRPPSLPPQRRPLLLLLRRMRFAPESLAVKAERLLTHLRLPAA